MSQPITTTDARRLLLVLMDHGLRAPDVYDRPGGLDQAAESYAQLFAVAGVSIEEARAAVAAYLLDPPPLGGFAKPWPDVGTLIARTPRGRAMAYIGSKTDAERAFEAFRVRMVAVGFDPSSTEPARMLDPHDRFRDAAMRAALAACGGGDAWGLLDLSSSFTLKEVRARWIDAYGHVRVRDRHNPEAIATAARRLAASEARPIAQDAR